MQRYEPRLPPAFPNRSGFVGVVVTLVWLAAPGTAAAQDIGPVSFRDSLVMRQVAYRAPCPSPVPKSWTLVDFDVRQRVAVQPGGMGRPGARGAARTAARTQDSRRSEESPMRPRGGGQEHGIDRSSGRLDRRIRSRSGLACAGDDRPSDGRHRGRDCGAHRLGCRSSAVPGKAAMSADISSEPAISEQRSGEQRPANSEQRMTMIAKNGRTHRARPFQVRAIA